MGKCYGFSETYKKKTMNAIIEILDKKGPLTAKAISTELTFNYKCKHSSCGVGQFIKSFGGNKIRKSLKSDNCYYYYLPKHKNLIENLTKIKHKNKTPDLMLWWLKDE